MNRSIVVGRDMDRATRNIAFLLLFVGFSFLSSAQTGLLEKHISIRVSQKPLAQALREIGRKGDLYFSYNSNILKGDSVVSLDADNKSIRQILDILLRDNYEYGESGRYIILQPKAAAAPARAYMISGWIVDATTKRRVSHASVYEADQLVSAMTDTNGYFRLRLKERNARSTITVSKELYRDTILFVREGQDQEYTLLIEPARITELAPFVVSSRVERTWMGRLLLSSRQKIQSLNIFNFFADKPIQFSLTPGLGTHGQMGAQVVNKFSLNLLGGYTAGSNGLELAGLFNIDKKDVNYVQVAGLFNAVGGDTKGVQLAGLHNYDVGMMEGVQASGLFNRVGDRTTGVQLAGLYNQDHGAVRGLQAAGLYNDSRDSVAGVQAAGLTNRAGHSMQGLQVAGLANTVNGTVRGVQASGLFNYTRHLKGLQVGLINVADTSSGLMIGLINIVKQGYHALSLSSNEILPLNLSYKAGGRTLYSILLAGMDPRNGERAYSLGFGIGANFPLAAKWSVTTDLTMQYYYLGNWTGVPVVYRFQPAVQWRITKKLGLFTGPSLSLYDNNNADPGKGYKTSFPASSRNTFSIGNSTAWFGWTAGINFL